MNKRDNKHKGRGLTRQRAAVLRAVRDRHDHPTAKEIFEEAQRSLPGISYATVYNSLRYLRGAGLVREINFGDHASRYDRETARHDHALCVSCGKLVDFDLPATPQLMREAARKSQFKPESVYLTLRGLCPDCRKALKT